MRYSGIYDVFVVVGGINCAGIARDAAGRGLSVLLCEQHDRFLRSLERAHPWLPATLRYRYAHAYGTRVTHILRGARSVTDLGEELLPQLYEREVEYLCEAELAQTAEDILWRRTRLGLRVGAAGLARLEDWLARRNGRAPDPAYRPHASVG